MVDKRNHTPGMRAEQDDRRIEALKSDITEEAADDKFRQLMVEVVKLRRTISHISDDDAKRVLLSCNLDVKRAIIILRSRQHVDSHEPIDLTAEGPGAVLGTGIAAFNHSERSRKRKALDFSEPCNEFVKIMVGRDGYFKQPFTIPRPYLCQASPYFERAINERVLVEDSKSVSLEISFTCPAVFGIFQRWVLCNKITDIDNKLPPVILLVSLWILAGTFQAPTLQNLAIRGLFGQTFCSVSAGFIQLYRDTEPGCALRKLYIDSVVVRKMSPQAFSDLLDNHWDGMPDQMKKDVVLAQRAALLVSTTGSPLSPLKIEDYLVPEQIQQDDGLFVASKKTLLHFPRADRILLSRKEA